MTRPVVDEQSESEFLRKMREAFARRVAATSLGDKRAIEREMEKLLSENRTRSVWDAARDAEAVGAGVPRDTRVDSTCRTPVVQSDHALDWKQRQARNDD